MFLYLGDVLMHFWLRCTHIFGVKGKQIHSRHSSLCILPSHHLSVSIKALQTHLDEVIDLNPPTFHLLLYQR